MDTAPLILVFIFFTGLSLALNALISWLAGRAVGDATAKVTTMVQAFGEAKRDNREWVASLLSASQQALDLTETTKQRMSDLEPVLKDMHDRYGFFLAQVDARIERIATGVSDNATLVRDALAKPAQAFANCATNVQNLAGLFYGRSDE